MRQWQTLPAGLVAVAATAARGAAERISDPEDLRPALAGIGQTCKSCHGAYRE